MNKMLIVALREATTKEAVEDLFNRFGIKDTEEKINYLVKTMQVGEVSYGRKGAGIEDKYNISLALFLKGEWRIILGLREILGFEKNSD